MALPNITYTITFNGNPIPLGGQVKASFVDGYNKIHIKFTSNVSLRLHLVRVTPAGQDFDVDLGYILHNTTGSISTSGLEYDITIDGEHFKSGDISYRISLYSKDAVYNIWDKQYILLASDGSRLKDSNNAEMYSVTNKEIK